MKNSIHFITTVLSVTISFNSVAQHRTRGNENQQPNQTVILFLKIQLSFGIFREVRRQLTTFFFTTLILVNLYYLILNTLSLIIDLING